MSDKPVTMGLIGYGHYTKTNFGFHIGRECKAIKIVGVYNRGEERRQQAADDGYWTTGDLDELLAMPELESVFIGTSNSSHRELAIRAAEAGKHIICEKPLAINTEDMDAMLEAVESAGVVNHVNHSGPYGPGFIKFRELVQKEAGDILHYWKRVSRAYGTWVQGARHVAVANPEESGGWTFHHFCHQLNEACLIVNSPVIKVYHVSQKSCDEAPSEEYVNAFLHFENGATAFLSDTTSIGPFGDLGVQGTKADVRFMGNGITVAKPGPGDPLGRPGNRRAGELVTHHVQSMEKNLVAVGNAFAAAVRGGPNELISFRFVRDQYTIMNALRESAQKGEPVEIKW